MSRHKTYYSANREIILAKKKAKYKSKPAYKTYRETPYGRFTQIRNSAKNRGKEFTLTAEEYEDKYWKSKCYFCGRASTGIDRINNEVGYVEGNMRPCCTQCNLAKNTYSDEEFLSMCRAVVRLHSKVKSMKSTPPDTDSVTDSLISLV